MAGTFVVLLAGVSVTSVAAPVLDGLAPGVRTGEPHPPIEILSEADLLVPDSISQNGVRGGAGTADDPYRISGWTISGAQGTNLLRIEGVTSHILVEAVHFSGERELGSEPIQISNSRNVELRNLEFSGSSKRWAVYADASTVTISGSLRTNSFASEGSCVHAHQAELHIVSADVVGSCAPLFLRMLGGSLQASKFTMEQARSVLLVSDKPTQITFSDSSLVRGEASDSRALGEGEAVHSGLGFENLSATRIEIQDVALSGFGGYCIKVNGSGNDEAIVTLTDVRCADCDCMASIVAEDTGQSKFTIQRLTTTGRGYAGISAAGSIVSVFKSAISGHEVGVYGWTIQEMPETRVNLFDSAIVAAGPVARADGNAEITVTDSWLSGKAPTGRVNVVRPQTRAPPGVPEGSWISPADESPSLQPAWALTAIALAGIAMARRRRKSRK